jgi:hypothetical protein
MSDASLYLHLALGLGLFGISLARKVRAWRGVALAAVAGLILTGAFNFMTRMKGAPPLWHALIGIKILLALHVVAVVLLITRGTGSPERDARLRRGALISGAIVIAIGLYLSNFTH